MKLNTQHHVSSTVRLLIGLCGGVCVIFGAGCQSSGDSGPYVKRKAGWVEDLHQWYPDWKNDDAKDNADLDQQIEWAYQLRAWYPDWQPQKVVRPQPAGKSPAPEMKAPVIEPMPATSVPAPIPSPPAVSTPPAVPAARPTAPPPPVVKMETPPVIVPAKKVAAPEKKDPISSTVPAAHLDFRIVPEDGDAASDGTFIRNGRRYYTIRKGDTLSRIAEQVYGNPKAWQRIKVANPYVITNVNALTVGATIRIP